MRTLKGCIASAFDAWLKEPSYNSEANGSHLNTRTTDCCEVAFNAGWDAAVKAASFYLDRQGAESSTLVELEKLLPRR